LRTQNLRTKPCVRTLVNSMPGADRQCTLISQISSRSVYYVGLERQKIPQGGPSATIVPSAFRALFRTVNVPALELEALLQGGPSATIVASALSAYALDPSPSMLVRTYSIHCCHCRFCCCYDVTCYYDVIATTKLPTGHRPLSL